MDFDLAIEGAHLRAVTAGRIVNPNPIHINGANDSSRDASGSAHLPQPLARDWTVWAEVRHQSTGVCRIDVDRIVDGTERGVNDIPFSAKENATTQVSHDVGAASTTRVGDSVLKDWIATPTTIARRQHVVVRKGANIVVTINDERSQCPRRYQAVADRIARAQRARSSPETTDCWRTPRCPQGGDEHRLEFASRFRSGTPGKMKRRRRAIM
ncbi:MAG TPA: hypothetical protein VJN18_21950 [Polyangiaceae bacterium]|nr:hypothetical protein [Polyangiaceae bacterium]